MSFLSVAFLVVASIVAITSIFDFMSHRMTIISRFLVAAKAYLFPTIDHVISDLTAKVDHLRDLAVQHEQHAVQRAEEAAKHLAAQVFHNGESDRARRVATKIEKLVA